MSERAGEWQSRRGARAQSSWRPRLRGEVGHRGRGRVSGLAADVERRGGQAGEGPGSPSVSPTPTPQSVPFFTPQPRAPPPLWPAGQAGGGWGGGGYVSPLRMGRGVGQGRVRNFPESSVRRPRPCRGESAPPSPLPPNRVVFPLHYPPPQPGCRVRCGRPGPRSVTWASGPCPLFPLPPPTRGALLPQEGGWFTDVCPAVVAGAWDSGRGLVVQLHLHLPPAHPPTWSGLGLRPPGAGVQLGCAPGSRTKNTLWKNTEFGWKARRPSVLLPL